MLPIKIKEIRELRNFAIYQERKAKNELMKKQNENFKIIRKNIWINVSNELNQKLNQKSKL